MLAAVLFADVVDSTELQASIGSEAARTFWAEHDRRARSLIRAHRGIEVGRSDGFLLVFEDCADAIDFAFAYHRATAALATPMRARVGLHWGPAELRQNSAEDVAAGATPHELDGLALPTAARVMGVALGGQTLVSADAAAAVGGRRACQRISHGHWRLKGLAEPVELFEVAEPGQATLGPPPDTAKAYRVLLRGGIWQPVREVATNLGPELDTFVGRQAALQALADQYEAGARLVTLLGTGGVGKTRLACRYARAWLGQYPGGAWFCDLSAAADLDGITRTLALTLSVPLGRTDPVQQLGLALAGRGDCLLILDNFEQVARHAEATLAVWLQAAPALRVLVTSREVLGLPGERTQVLAPLDAAEAEAMFRLRIEAAGAAGDLRTDDAEALPRLVELLDRLPLAIELAAARSRLLAPAEQLRRIGERFRLLAGGRGRHDRQATLRATLDWSWDLLAVDERLALAQLSVFEGGFDIDAAEQVLDLGAAGTGRWVADVLQALLDKSLLRRVHARRFDLLRSVQEYAGERLAAMDAGAEQRHWRWYAGHDEAVVLRAGPVDLDNRLVACRRACAAGDAAAGPALLAAWALLRMTGPFRAVLPMAETLLARGDLAPGTCAIALRVAGGAWSLLGRVDEAVARYHAALGHAEAAGHHEMVAELLCLLADLDVQRGQFEDAGRLIERGAHVSTGLPKALLRLHNSRGQLALARGDTVQAVAQFEAALGLAQHGADARWQEGLHGTLGAVLLARGDLGPARRHLERGLQLAQALGDRQWAANARCNLGLLLHRLGEGPLAHQHLDVAVQEARAMGHRRLEATALCNLGLVLEAGGAAAGALGCLVQAVELAQGLALPRMEAEFRAVLAEQWVRAGEPGQALICVEAGRHALAVAALPPLAQLEASAAVALAASGRCAEATGLLASTEATMRTASDDEAERALRRAREFVSRRC